MIPELSEKYVTCDISFLQGVPLSTQWGSKGYFYPIQIAQFAMSHYSKNITEKPSIKTIYESGEMLEVG